ncbi:MAG TPA: glycosyltransferase family 1 protein [Thermoflexales bacterium]|nr:glycosyltransferase family 1 protein [Thermoflexales bacterium]HQW34099.1 glycosyltransferase family 1 protein [Thermoflexales bacterium]
MRILFDGRVIQDHFPGIGRYAFNLALALRDLLRPNDALDVLVARSAKNTRYDLNALTSQTAQSGLAGVHVIPTDAAVFSPQTALGQLPASKIDLAHFPYYIRPYVWRGASVTTVYDMIPFLMPEALGSARARLTVRLLTAQAVRASRAILTISNASRDDIARFFPSAKNKITVTPLAHDAMFCPQPPAEIERIRAKFGLPERFTLYIASNKPHKNLVRLVEAWKELVGYWVLGKGDQQPTTNNQQLIIAGHYDPRFPEAKTRVKELGLKQNVRFIENVPNADMPALYSACALFVYPSLYEGFGLTPLEAMACGAPVICSNTSSMPEVMGEAGILVNPASPNEIAQACLRVLGDEALRGQLRAQSLARAAQFSWRKTAEETIGVYRLVASG